MLSLYTPVKNKFIPLMVLTSDVNMMTPYIRYLTVQNCHYAQPENLKYTLGIYICVT